LQLGDRFISSPIGKEMAPSWGGWVWAFYTYGSLALNERRLDNENGGERQFDWEVADGRFVPNATERAVIERMKSMRADGATYREIGGEVGMYGRTVQRILDRA
jgi:hypothetical protein